MSKVCWVRKDIDRSPGELYITANRVHILRDSKLSELYCGYSLRGNYDSALYSSTELFRWSQPVQFRSTKWAARQPKMDAAHLECLKLEPDQRTPAQTADRPLDRPESDCCSLCLYVVAGYIH